MATNPISNTPSKRVLIVLLGAIGDVCRALPLAVRIRRSWPSVQLDWAVEPKSAGLIKGHSALNNVIVFDRPGGLQAYRRFLRRLQAEHYDLVLDLQRHLKSGFTTWSTGAGRRVGFNRRNAKEGNWLFSTEQIPAVENFSPKIEHYQLFGDQLGLPRMFPLEFGLAPRTDQIERVQKLLGEGRARFTGAVPAPYLGLILGSSWPSRIWPESRYYEVIQRVSQDRTFVPVLIGAKGEEGIRDAIVSKSKDLPVIDLVGKLDLGDLAALFTLTDAVVGPDSGPMHIAAAVKTPVVSFWGATSPERSAPYGSEQYVIRSAIGCSPCYRRRCPGLGQLCITQITADEVLSRVGAATQKTPID